MIVEFRKALKLCCPLTVLNIGWCGGSFADLEDAKSRDKLEVWVLSLCNCHSAFQEFAHLLQARVYNTLARTVRATNRANSFGSRHQNIRACLQKL